MPRASRDADSEVVRDLLLALRDDHPADLDLEVEALRARRALVEMPGDGPPLPDGELAVEVLVDAEDRVVAVHLAVQPPVAESTRGRRLFRSA